MKQDTISVVIPFHNASSTILESLRALENSALRPMEVICVDDASTDIGSRMVERYATMSPLNVLLTKNPKGKRGAAAARNWGAQKTQGQYLLFLDSDVIVNAYTIERLMCCLKARSCTAVVALFEEHSMQPGILAHFQAFTVNAVYKALNSFDSPCLGTQCALIEADQFYTSGGFDESYYGATIEDFAFGYKLRDQGAVICISKAATIIHNHVYNLKAFFRNYFIKARDLTKLLLTHPQIKLVDTGYHHISNVLTLIVVVFQILLITLGLTMNEWFVWISIFLFVLMLSLIWARFFLQVKQKFGLYTGVMFTGLRIIVVIIGWIGSVSALLDVLYNGNAPMSNCFSSFFRRLNELLKLSANPH